MDEIDDKKPTSKITSPENQSNQSIIQTMITTPLSKILGMFHPDQPICETTILMINLYQHRKSSTANNTNDCYYYETNPIIATAT